METRARVAIQKEREKRIPEKDGVGVLVEMAYSSKSF